MSCYVLEQPAPIRRYLLSRALRAISVVCMTLATIPPSSILGAMLWVGYVGNLVATHLNMIQT